MTRVISLSDEAYENLKRLKKEGDSFSEVVNQLAATQKPSLLDSAGKWAGSDAEFGKILKILRDDRKKFKLRDVNF